MGSVPKTSGYCWRIAHSPSEAFKITPMSRRASEITSIRSAIRRQFGSVLEGNDRGGSPPAASGMVSLQRHSSNLNTSKEKRGIQWQLSLKRQLSTLGLTVLAGLSLTAAALAQFGGLPPGGFGGPDAAPRVPSGVNTLHDLAYVPNGHPRQKLDLYLPPGGGAKRPLIVYVHGGAFMFGDKSSGLMPMRLLTKGYAIASLDYRLSGDALFPAQIQDCKAAVRWLRAHAAQYRLDPARFVAWGESAGANLAALLGTAGQTRTFDVGANLRYSSAVRAVVDYYGPTDFLQAESIER